MTSGMYGSTFYMLTGFHGFHVTLGAIMLTVILFRCIRGHFTNENHFGFGDIQVTENAQFTEYPVGGFYDWHMDCDINMQHEPPVRKISMTLLLNHESQFEGGDLELMAPGKRAKLTQGNAVIFASFINHRVAPVIRGVRQSLVMWFGGTPFR